MMENSVNLSGLSVLYQRKILRRRSNDMYGHTKISRKRIMYFRRQKNQISFGIVSLITTRIKHEQIRNAGQLEKYTQNKKSSSFKRYKQLFNKPLHGGVFLMKQKINHRFSRWFFMGIFPTLHTRQNAYVIHKLAILV